MPCLFAEIDFKQSSEADVRTRLAAFPLEPSIVINSGGGLHAYWLLHEPIDLQRDAEATKTLLRRIAYHVGADFASAEPARVLRLPNCWNLKYDPRRPVTVERFAPDRRVNPSDLDDVLPDIENAAARVLPGPLPDGVPLGARNDHLTRQAGAMRRRGMGEAAIAAALLVENGDRCRPPLPEPEVRRIAASVGRYVPDPSTEPVSLITSLTELLARASAHGEPQWLVDGLIPGDGTVLIHSQPREYKTLSVQALLLSMATGTPAFGLERLHVAEPVPVLYLTEEDAWRRVAQRCGALLNGYGITQSPDLFHIAAGKGINLDALEWQERLIAATREQGYRVVGLDPLRSLTDSADQGPRELKPFALFVRRLMRETGAVVLIVHHDTKPPANAAADQRRRPQRASGGGIFSIADSPIHVDRVDEHRRILVPCSYKFSADPPPVTVRLEQGPGWLRLMGEESTAVEPNDAIMDRRILDYLKDSPYAFGSNVAKGVRGRKDDVLRRLKELATRGLVDAVDEPRGTKWFRTKAS